MRRYVVLMAVVAMALSAQAQVKAPYKVLQHVSQKESKKVFRFSNETANWKHLVKEVAAPAQKKSSFLLDSVETYFYDGSDSTLVGNRFFDYDGDDRLENDESYEVDSLGVGTGDERTSYEYKPGLFAEMTHFWDQAVDDWDYSERIEIRADLRRGDTVFSRSEYTWNTLTDKWDGFRAQAFLDRTITGGSYEVSMELVYDLTNRVWVFETMDSSFTDANGNVTHQKSSRWNTTTNMWDVEEEVKSTYSTRTNDRIRIREEWNADSNKFVMADSFVFTYVADTILESGYYYGYDDNGNFDTLSFLTSIVVPTKDSVIQVFYRRDAQLNDWVEYLGRLFILNGQNEIIGFEEMDLDLEEGIRKTAFSENAGVEAVIDYEWNYQLEDWVLSEKQEYSYNSEGFATLNSFYVYDTVNNLWEGIEKRTYVFKSDDETVLNRTEYAWDYTNNNWIVDEKADFTYDGDNDPLLVVRSVYDESALTWVVDEKDYFYYGTWQVGSSKVELSVIDVYPNPTASTLQFSQTLNLVRVLDMNGRNVMNAQTAQQLNVAHLKAGVYQVTGVLNGTPVSTRFIKQ